MEKRSLKQLSDEYYESVELLQQLIDSKRLLLSRARRAGRRNEEYSLQRCLKLLYQQRRELDEIAGYLRHYYRCSVANKPAM